MRWMTNLPGDLRMLTRFAFAPTETCSGEVVWLERYYDFQRYEKFDDSALNPWYTYRRQAL